MLGVTQLFAWRSTETRAGWNFRTLVAASTTSLPGGTAAQLANVSCKGLSLGAAEPFSPGLASSPTRPDSIRQSSNLRQLPARSTKSTPLLKPDEPIASHYPDDRRFRGRGLDLFARTRPRPSAARCQCSA